jgi:hypothetical protein
VASQKRIRFHIFKNRGIDDRQYCSIKINNVQYDDVLYFSLNDAIAVFADTSSESFEIQISDLFENAA